jgi:hypothetical protein
VDLSVLQTSILKFFCFRWEAGSTRMQYGGRLKVCLAHRGWESVKNCQRSPRREQFPPMIL